MRDYDIIYVFNYIHTGSMQNNNSRIKIYIYKWKKKWNVTLHQKLEGKKSSWFKRRNTLESAVNKCKIHLIIISWCEAGIIKHLHVWKIHNAALHLSAATSSLWLYLLASTKVAYRLPSSALTGLQRYCFSPRIKLLCTAESRYLPLGTSDLNRIHYLRHIHRVD